jgi:hypothetical protein
MAKIVAPNRAYNGQIGDVVFRDGIAETDNQAIIAYCREAGYEVDGTTDNPAALPQVQVDSSRTHDQLGTPLRDAAVDPQPGDFLPPVNAGQADPHGPQVVSPEIHASPGPTPIVPGPVLDDPAGQQARESAAAEQTLIEQKPVGDVVQALAEDSPAEPAGNAGQAAWADWVIATHPELDPESVRAMKRDDLRETYGS